MHLKKMVCLSVFCLMLTGCGNENTEQAKEVEEETAAPETSIDEKAGLPLEDEQALNEVKAARDNADWEGVLEKAHALLENASLDDSTRTELEEMIVEAETEINNSIRENFEQNSSKADEAGNPHPDSGSEGGSKETYLMKLAAVEKEVQAMEDPAKLVTQAEMTEAQGNIYAKWDEILNEIYGELKKQLSGNDMNKLRDEQRQWIQDRDEQAKEAAKKFEGGSMETLEYVSTQAKLTEERAYELVKTYMK
ncbi:lysozyme inhibitor LprI family protein [Solibacillus silvestris]|uniref:lysozyme inhibitor LprI family protein n=1 Tax=Solibacillus silvestris TaxID=76853 RepID=UPI003F7DFAB3